MKEASPKAQLDGFIDKFTPEVAKVARAALRQMRKLLPGAIELAYDNYNALAIAFSPTERASDAIFSIALYPRWVSLFFAQGAKLKDPSALLKGSGKGIRHIVLEDLALFDDPAVRALMKQALAIANPRLDAKAKNRLVIKSISPKQRPRRPSS
jgi:hypothetical protein